jgi:hypothetical protein
MRSNRLLRGVHRWRAIGAAAALVSAGAAVATPAHQDEARQGGTGSDGRIPESLRDPVGPTGRSSHEGAVKRVKQAAAWLTIG